MKPSTRLAGLVLMSLMFVQVALSQQHQEPEHQEPEHQEPKQQESLPKGYHEVGPDRAAALGKLCGATAETGLFSGAVLVADHGQIIYQQAFGKANREWDISNTTKTKFRLASVSKQFCSMLVMQLVQEGKVKLDDTITDYLPYYRKDTGDRITIHHLLSHQSGIKDFTTSFDYRGTISRSSFGKDEFIKQHCSGDMLSEPGTIYSYCNAGYCILGRIIEKATGKSYEQNLHDRIFEPLGMNSSGYDRNRYVIKNRASGYTYGPFGLENADYIEMDSTPGAAGAALLHGRRYVLVGSSPVHRPTLGKEVSGVDVQPKSRCSRGEGRRRKTAQHLWLWVANLYSHPPRHEAAHQGDQSWRRYRRIPGDGESPD